MKSSVKDKSLKIPDVAVLRRFSGCYFCVDPKLGNLKRMHALASWCPDRTLVYVVDGLHLIDVETFQYRRGVS